MNVSKVLTLALVLGICPVVAVSMEPAAPPFEVSDVNTAVPNQPGVTYFDLLVQLVPDLVANETLVSGQDMAPLRHIRGPEYNWDMPETITIDLIRAQPYQAEGKPIILLMADIGRPEDFAEAPALLAAFRDTNPPVLLDAVDVGMGRLTDFDVSAVVSIGKGSQAMVTSSQHFNSNENHTIDALIYMRGGKFELIDTFFLHGVRGCGLEQWQDLSVEGQPATPGSYGDIKVTVTDARELVDDACDEVQTGPTFSRAVTVIYKWDADKKAFVAGSDAIKQLEKETAARL